MGKTLIRSIQPIGIYPKDENGIVHLIVLKNKDYRVFRCDRIKSVERDENNLPYRFIKYLFKKPF